MAAEQAKDRGNRAFAAGNFADAVSSFSEALALHARDPAGGNAHVYHSNRSAAYLKLGDAPKALQDADACIQLKRDWPKGYSRRGAALYALGRLADAQRAYQDGLALHGANPALLDGLRSVEAKLAAAQSFRPPSSSANGSNTTAPRPASSLRAFVAADKAALFRAYQFGLRSLMLALFVLYWLPLGSLAFGAFALFFQLALVNYGSFLFFTHGLPKWQAAYAQRLVLDPATQSLFFCLVFWVSAPHGLALLPVMLVEAVHLFAYLSALLDVLGLGANPLVTAVKTKALLPLAAAVIRDPQFPSLAPQTKWARLYQRVPLVAANLEVALGLALLLELLTPARNVLLLVLYWQVLRVRYMISQPLQEASRQLHVALLTLVSHPRCPAVIGSLYTKVHAFAAKMVDVSPPQQGGAGPGGLASRCTVM